MTIPWGEMSGHQMLLSAMRLHSGATTKELAWWTAYPEASVRRMLSELRTKGARFANIKGRRYLTCEPGVNLNTMTDDQIQQAAMGVD